MGKAAENLSISELEGIASGLFKVTSRQGDEFLGLCPIHEDKNPSFSYNAGKDVCHCFGCGFSGDIIDLWCRVKGHMDKAEGFKAFCEAYDINNGAGDGGGGGGSGAGPRVKKPELPSLDDAYAMLAPLPEAWRVRLRKTRGWSDAAMDTAGLRMQTHYQAKDTGQIRKLSKPERIAIPIKDTQGVVRNIRLYKPGAQKMKIISWGAKYGGARLLPARPGEKEPVLLVEGESDQICAESNGFNAITQTTKPKKWSKAHLAMFKDRHVVIAFDADQPGVMYAEKYAGPSLVKVAKSVKILTWPDFMGRRDDGLWPEDHGQDLTDFFVKHRKTPEDLQDLMFDAKSFDVKEEALQPQALEFFSRSAGSERLSFKPRLLAEAIIKKKQLLSDPDTGLLYRWNGRFWEQFNVDHVKRMAIEMLGDESMTARVSDSVSQVLILATIPHSRMVNDMTEWMCVHNGMLNYRTLELRDHGMEYFATYEANINFNPDSKKKCDRWLQFLDETIQTPEAIAQVQEFFGYCLLRDVPFAKCLLLKGPGSDGKSKLIKILREMVGPENTSTVGFAEMEDQFMRSSLYQKTVNISTEVGAKAIESPYFKAITAGDPINAAFKHKDTFNFVPYCKLIFAANRLPRVLDNSDGFYRRILPVLFKKQFLENDPSTDPFLEKKLMSELSEIFAWSLVGLHRLLKNGKFTDCEETQDLLQDYRRLNSPVICFVEDVCLLDDGGQTSKEELYTKYTAYTREAGTNPYGREKFFRELYASVNTLKVCRVRSGRGREYHVKGIRLTMGYGS